MKEQNGLMKGSIRWLYLLLLIVVVGCGTEDKQLESSGAAIKSKKTVKKIPLVSTASFNSDSAFGFVQKQVDFGPRVPNTKEHNACANFLVNQLYRFGLDTSIQRAKVRAYNNKILNAKNIIGRFKPELNNRILLFAHWDTRPYADRGKERRTKPIDGANDGGSGVAVLLELARAIHSDSIKPNIGFDIVFFDAEDYGQPDGTMVSNAGGTWCLGSQYFASNIPFTNYRPRYGICLDMVGAANAVFPKEGVSMYYAPQVVNNVWRIAKELGYGNYFSDAVISGGLTDDHTYINQIANIPSIDIIHYEINRRDFGTFHHTHDDNLSLIDKEPLKAVGETVMQVLYQEQ